MIEPGGRSGGRPGKNVVIRCCVVFLRVFGRAFLAVSGGLPGVRSISVGVSGCVLLSVFGNVGVWVSVSGELFGVVSVAVLGVRERRGVGSDDGSWMTSDKLDDVSRGVVSVPWVGVFAKNCVMVSWDFPSFSIRLRDARTRRSQRRRTEGLLRRILPRSLET